MANRTFGWIQNPSDFSKLKNVVALFCRSSNIYKELVGGKLEELVDDKKLLDKMLKAYAFAEADPYRAATHNKGIMNGIIPVITATGNDTRAIEAGAHSYASRNGRYTSLTTWEKDENGDLVGTIEMPMAVGLVGGAP